MEPGNAWGMAPLEESYEVYCSLGIFLARVLLKFFNCVCIIGRFQLFGIVGFQWGVVIPKVDVILGVQTLSFYHTHPLSLSLSPFLYLSLFLSRQLLCR